MDGGSIAAIVVAIVTALGTLIKTFIDNKHSDKEAIKQIDKKVDNLTEKFDESYKQREKSSMWACRRRIIDFAGDLKFNESVIKSREQYNDVRRDIDRYTTYCQEHPDFENDVCVDSIHYIEVEMDMSRIK